MAGSSRPDDPPKIPENSPQALDYQEEHDIGAMHAALDRENHEPHDGMEPIPLWLMALFMVIVFWAGTYMMAYSGAFQADTKAAYTLTFMGGEAASAGGSGGGAGGADSGPKELTPEVKLALGKRYYTQNCVSCHQTTGMGVAGQNPPLAGSDIVLGSEKQLAAILLHGLKGPIMLNGSMSTWSGNMAPWTQIDDNKLSYILTYIRQEWGNDAPPITPETVAAVRAETAAHKGQWTWDELAPFR